MTALEEQLRRARAGWQYTGSQRPRFAEPTGPGEESVWDYPRPPRLEPVRERVTLGHAGVCLAHTDRALRVCETASPPTYYVPVAALLPGVLVPESGGSLCEWKGRASYYGLDLRSHTDRPGVRLSDVAWRYAEPFPGFEPIAEYVAFYPGKIDVALVGDVRASPQPGGYYGGWVLPFIKGPFKGEADTGHW